MNRFEEGICGCCARREIGIGHIKKSGRPIIWVCDDPECLAIAQRTYSMKQDQFSRLESLAVQEGGNEGLWYLEDIGKTDLTTLTIDEMCEFKRRMIAGYRKELKAKLTGEVSN